MKLPIQQIPGTVPPQFIYYQKVNLPGGGVQILKHTGAVASSMETALCDLIKLTKRLLAENEALRQ